MGIKHPNVVESFTKVCCIFYKSPGRGETLIEVRDARRQRVVSIPSFLKKVNIRDLRPYKVISPSKTKSEDDRYGYRHPHGLMTINQEQHIWDRGRFPQKDIKDWVEMEEPRGELLGNHASIVSVKENKILLCRYIICGRFMGSSNEELVHQLLKNPDRFSTHLIEGDESYITQTLPRGRDLINFTGWVTSGFYFDKTKLIIRPIPKPIFPKLVNSRAGVHVVSVTGTKTLQSIESSEDVSNVYYIGYRSADDLRFKVDTSEYKYIKDKDTA